MPNTVASITASLLFFLTPLFSQPSSQEIAAALDDSSGLPWTVSAEGTYSIEVVDDPTAINGTALKLVVSNSASLLLQRAFDGDGIVTYDYKIESPGLNIFQAYNYGIYFEWLPREDVPISTWIPMEYPHTISDEFGWRIESPNAETSRVLYLDNLSYSEGFPVTVTGQGVSVEVIPSKPTYLPGETIIMKATPIDGDYEFLYWEEQNARIPVSGPGRKEIVDWISPNSFAAMGGKRFSHGEAQVIVPVDVLVSDDGGVIELDSSNSNQRWIKIRAPGPGMLSYKLEGSGSVNGDSFSASEGEPIERSFWVAPGPISYEMPFSGNFLISGFEYKTGYPVEVTTLGLGAVKGIPEDNFSLNGEAFTLTAEPEEGWGFLYWSGTVISEENPLEISTVRNERIQAVFGRTQSLLGWETVVVGDYDWTEETDGNSTFLKAPTYIDTNSISTLVWEIEGPGKFAFRYQSNRSLQKLVLNGEDTGLLYDPNSAGPTDIALELGPGQHRLEVFLDNRDYSGRSLDLTIQNISWTAGIAVTLVPTSGGNVTGLDPGTTRVPAGTVLDLAVMPDEGNVFDGWRGNVTGQEPEKSITVYQTTEVDTAFSQPIAGDSWVTQTAGDAFWTLVDGTWHTPATMEIGESALLTGLVQGPAELVFRLDSLDTDNHGVVRWWLDGTQKSGGNTNRTHRLYIPDGGHTLTLEMVPESNGQYNPHKLTEFILYYPVSISMEFGTFSSDPTMDYQPEEKAWTGVFAAGTEISFTAEGGADATFKGWTGDLEGLAASGSFLVQGPTEATGLFETSGFSTGGELAWTVSPVGSAFLPENGVLSLIDPDGEITISTNLSGPGYLSIRIERLLEWELRMNGSVLNSLESNAFPIAYYALPEGLHELEFFMRSDPDKFAISTSSPMRLRAGIISLTYTPGYVILTPANGRGSIILDPPESVVTSGTAVTFTATPREGNRFTGWSAPFENEADTFTKNIVDNVLIQANFAAAQEAGGYSWEFEGPPDYFTPSSAYPNGSLLFTLDPSDPIKTQSAEASFDGPGVLQYRWWTNGILEELNPRFLVDGQTIQFTPNATEIPLGPGSHAVRFEVDTPFLDEDGYLSTFRLELPDWSTEFSITATGQQAAVTVEPAKETYAALDNLTLTAPATNESGHLFSGWWDNNSNTQVSRNPVWQTTVQGDANYQAKYIPDYWQLDSVATQLSDPENWQFDPATPGPSGNPALVATSSGTIQLTALEDCVVSFALKLSGTNQAVFEFSSLGYSYSSTSQSQDWKPFQIFLESNETLTFAFQDNADDARAILGDLLVSRGWKPTVVATDTAFLTFSPNLEELAPGDTFTAEVIPELKASHLGWFGFQKIIFSHETYLTGVVGEHTFFHPNLVMRLPVPGVSVAEGSSGWIPSLETENEDFIYDWKSRLNNTEKSFHDLNLIVSGPSALSFDLNIHVGPVTGKDYLEIFIDGSPAPLERQLAPDVGWNTLYVNSGEHVLTFRHVRYESRADATLSNMWLHQGVVQRGMHYDQGEVRVSPASLFFSPGETVEVEAIPDAGWSFIDWQPPFSGMPPTFTHTSNEPVNFIPIWKETVEEFDAYGLHWVANGMTVRLEETFDSEANQIRSRVYLTPAYKTLNTWVETEISGPSVLRWDASQGAGWSLKTLGGYPIDGPGNFSSFTEDGWKNLAIPKGVHRLRGKGLGTGMEIIPRFMVSIKALGFQFEESPHFGFYSAGTTLRIKIPKAIPVPLVDWIGLPQSAVVDGNSIEFTVNGHVNATGLLWHDENWFGFGIQHAGKNEWKPFSPGDDGFTQERIPSRFSDHLRLFPPGPGILQFGLANPASVFLEVQLNGVTIPSFSESGGGTRYIAVSGPEDTITWNFLETGVWREGFSGRRDDLRFTYMKLNEDIPESPYTNWIRKFSPSGRLNNQLIQLEGDPNQDGINNYLSFLLDESPFETVVLLGLLPREKDATITLWHPSYPEALKDSFIIEYSDSLSGDWKDAAEILGEPYIDPDHPEMTLCDILEPGLDGQPRFFRLRYVDYIPNLDVLFSQ